MPKTDYYDDPGAPRANSLVVAVTAVVLDDAGRVLLIQRTDNDLWAVPGGAQEVGETSTEATVRQEFSLCFRARPIGGHSRRAASPSTCTGSNPTVWTS